MNEITLARPPATRAQTPRFLRSMAVARIKAAAALVKEAETAGARSARELRDYAHRQLLLAAMGLEIADERERVREVA